MATCPIHFSVRYAAPDQTPPRAAPPLLRHYASQLRHSGTIQLPKSHQVLVELPLALVLLGKLLAGPFASFAYYERHDSKIHRDVSYGRLTRQKLGETDPTKQQP